jgi:hypothetical protein
MQQGGSSTGGGTDGMENRFSVLGGGDGKTDGISDRSPRVAVANEASASERESGLGSAPRGKFWWNHGDDLEEEDAMVLESVGQQAGRRSGAPVRVKLPFVPPVPITDTRIRHRSKSWSPRAPGAVTSSSMMCLPPFRFGP